MILRFNKLGIIKLSPIPYFTYLKIRLFSTNSHLRNNSSITEIITLKSCPANYDKVEIQDQLSNIIKLRSQLREIYQNINNKSQNDLVIDKFNLLFQNLDIIDINDLKLNNYQNIEFFKLLIDKEINFNLIEIKGIGKLLKNISNITNHKILGIDLIKNCGILNPNEKNETIINDIFNYRYNDTLRILTIDTLIQHKKYNDAYKFIELMEKLPINNETINNQLIKYKIKLSKFKNFTHLKPSIKEILFSNNIHIYLRELIKCTKISNEKKLEYYLLILYKYLKYCKLKSITITNTQLLSINTTFLSILSKEQGVSYSIFLAYFIKLFPKSIPLLEELNLLTTDDKYRESINNNERIHLDDNLKILHINDLPNVNIRDDLIMHNTYPYMETLSLLYGKYIPEKCYTRKQIKKCFKDYFNKVYPFQQSEIKYLLKSNDYKLHPFSINNHDSSILSVFIYYTFHKDIDKLFKPIFTSNYIIKFYEYLIINSLDYSKIRNNHFHIKQLNNIINYFIDTNNLKFNIEIAIKLINVLINHEIYLDKKIYLNLIDSTIKSDMIEDAKKIFDYITNNLIISNQLEWYEISKYCNKYRWKFPNILLKQVENLSIEEIKQLKIGDKLNENNESYKFDKNYLSKDLSPEKFVKLLDETLLNCKSNGDI